MATVCITLIHTLFQEIRWLSQFLRTHSVLQTRRSGIQCMYSCVYFPTERGRYLNVEFKDKVCTICDQKVSGDEIHYQMLC